MPDPTIVQTIDMGTPMESEEGLQIIDVLNEVGDVRAMSGPLVTFVGTLLGATGPIDNLTRVEAYRCPGGIFLHAVTTDGPHWATGGATVAEAVAAIEDPDLRHTIASVLADATIT